MHQHVRNSFTNVAVELDGNDFTDCTFQGCTLIYRGGRGPNMNGCDLRDSKFKFEGAAGNTVAFLKAMSKSGLRAVVK